MKHFFLHQHYLINKGSKNRIKWWLESYDSEQLFGTVFTSCGFI